MIKTQLLFFLFPGFLLNPQPEIPQKETIYVASISWHTGVVVPGYCLPDSIWPEGHDYSQEAYLEIGWGDRDFYQDLGFNFWYGVKAALWPTPSVIHVNPLPENVGNYYYNTEAVQLEVDRKELQTLTRFLLKHFDFNEEGKLIPLQSGIYNDSQFFAGRTSYYFPKNSNVWAAQALKRAGLPNIPILLQTTGMVINKADNHGERVGKKAGSK